MAFGASVHAEHGKRDEKKVPRALRGNSECFGSPVVQIGTCSCSRMALEYPDSALNQYSMANQPPYMLVGQPQNPQYGQQQSSYRNLPFNLSDHQQVASTSTAHLGTAPGASSSLPQTSFRAPAHKHAHHLHSIPPREKSTRTLIIDHMLWVHGKRLPCLDVCQANLHVGRTRFAQARAELGLTDRTGGPSSPNYIHRTRPESYEEEDEDGSEGEDVVTLKGRAGGHGENDAEEERIRKQDLSLARSLRLRAEGLEKVVTSMLEQPPPIHPINDEEILTPPTSPKLNPSSHSHPHRLPNGVRLRLALGTIINDLFARQAPPPPYRHTQIPNSKATTPSDVSPSVIPSPSDLPDALTALAPVSGAFARPLSPSRITQSSRSVQSSPPFQSSSYSPQGSSHMHNQYQPRRSQPPPSPSNVNTRPQPSARVKSLYAVGADPSTANSPPAFRCPRHLHTGCEICVEAKSPTRNAGAGSRGRSASTAGSSSNSWKAMPGGVGPGGGGITGWQEGTGVGSGLLRPSVQGSALRRKIIESGDDATAGAGNAKLSKLIPRFIRLSALVAAELGRESRGEEDASEDGRGREGSVAAASAATPTGNVSTPGRSGSVGWNASGTSGGFSPLPPSPTIPRATPQTQVNQARNRTYDQALRPSLEWYMLLSGLLTRAVLEGYLTAGWTGLQAVQCLLLVGLGMNENAKKRRNEDGDDDESDEEDGEEFADLYPDELPSLSDAVKILFPSLRDASSGIKDQAEEVYGVEMLERLKRVCTLLLCSG